MTYVFDGIKKDLHPEEPAQRASRRTHDAPQSRRMRRGRDLFYDAASRGEGRDQECASFRRSTGAAAPMAVATAASATSPVPSPTATTGSMSPATASR